MDITIEQSFRYKDALMQESGFPKMHHYAGFANRVTYTVRTFSNLKLSRVGSLHRKQFGI